MQLYVIGDYFTVNTFKLIGIDGQVFEADADYGNILNTIENLIKKEEIGMIIYNSFIREIVGQKFDDYLKRAKPVFFEIPDTDSEFKEENLQEFIQKVIGIKI